MLDLALGNAIADRKTYDSVELQRRRFARLRGEDPVHWTEPVGYRAFWAITKYAHIIEIERQADHFINAPRTKEPSIDFESKVREAMNGRPMLVRAKRIKVGDSFFISIGRHLAKAEIVAFFREFLQRIDRVELAGKPAWTETSFLGGLKRLPMRYQAH